MSTSKKFPERKPEKRHWLWGIKSAKQANKPDKWQRFISLTLYSLLKKERPATREPIIASTQEKQPEEEPEEMDLTFF